MGEGNVLYVALKNANAVAGFSINADGSLSPLAGSPFSAGKGTSSLAGCSCGPGGFLFAANNLAGSISAYSIDATTGVLTQISGSPFLATTPSGDILFVEGELFLPDASSNAIGGFVPDLSNGVVSAAPGSPFPAGSGPLALAYTAFPVRDPPSSALRGENVSAVAGLILEPVVIFCCKCQQILLVGHDIRIFPLCVEGRRLRSPRIGTASDQSQKAQWRFNADLPQSRCAALSSPREKTREKKTSGVSAPVHATRGATASRFAGRSANRTTPITRNKITSVKLRGTL